VAQVARWLHLPGVAQFGLMSGRADVYQILMKQSPIPHMSKALSLLDRGNVPRRHKEINMLDWKRTSLAVTTAGLLGVGAWAGLAPAAGATTVPAVTAVASPAADGMWPAQVNGHPAQLRIGAEIGYYIWHDNGGWHMEVTHPGRYHAVFSGWVTTDGTLRVQRVDDERNDLTRVGPHRHQLSFVFNNYGYLDGVHFETHGAQELTFHLYLDGVPVGAEHVFIGHADMHPTHVPFAIDRTAIK
jgi:hypothetical protein